MFKTLLINLVAIGSLSIAGCADTTAPTAEQIEREKYTVTHVINSKYPEQERELIVQLPESYFEQTDKHYPVLYILDGQFNLELTTETVATLVDAEKMPEMIIVGLDSGRTRTQDYRPGSNDSEWGETSGRFLQYIDIEVLPFIADQYRTTPYRLLSGHSIGGLFTTYAMIEKPALFDGYLTQSPDFRRRRVGIFLTKIDQLFDQNPELETVYFMTLGNERVIPPFLMGFVVRLHAACFSFMAGVIPPMPILGR